MKRTGLILLLSVLCIIAAPFANAAKKIKLACIGDSITYGLTIENRETDSYPAQLQNMLGEGWEVGNFGHSGATLLRKGHRPYMNLPEFSAVLKFVPDVAVIHLGINDTDPRDWPMYGDDFIGDYLAIIDSLRAVNPAVRILIARMTPIADTHHRFDSGTKIWHSMIQKAIETVAMAANVQLIDFYEPLHHYPWMFTDGLHPNKYGAAILASTVYSGITGDFGGLRMPILYTDNMVLPASKEFPVAGTADAGEKVTVRLGGKTFVAVASDSGKWKVIAGPFKPGPGGNLEISTKAKKLVFKDIAFGEIWLCSGQSNMAFRINEEADGGVSSIKETIGGDIRLFDMKPRWTAFHTQWDAAVIDSVRRLEYYNKAVWEKANEENIALFSAVAWHFGKKLSDAIGVPVGLICNAVGGSTTESWVSREYLENDFPAILRNWMDNDLIMEWARNCAKLNLKSGKDLPGTYKRHPYEPCYLYEAGLMPLENYPISGVIWYQGESNAERCFAHERLFPMLVGSWREFFGKDDLPFYYVQLSSINRPCWPVFRNSQRLLKDKLENVGMAVSSDLGDPYDVHPKVKKPIGERLARLALHGVYGYSDLVCSGPEIRSAVYKDGKVVCSFDSAQGLCTSDGKPLRELELYNGKDGLWHEVEAELCEDGKLIVDLGGKTLGRSPAIRYAWKPYSEGNLVNTEGLPASTFELEIVVDN